MRSSIAISAGTLSASLVTSIGVQSGPVAFAVATFSASILLMTAAWCLTFMRTGRMN